MKYHGFCFTFFGLCLVLLCEHINAQNKYNYENQDIFVNAANVPNFPKGKTANPLQPNVVEFPIVNPAISNFPAPKSYESNNQLDATQTYGGYSGKVQPSSSPLLFPSTSGTVPNVSQRPNIAQRTGARGIFGAPVSSLNSISQQQQQLANVGGLKTLESNEFEGDFSAIPGVPGIDYPIYSQIPQTNFDCRQQPLPGYYSNIEAQCQVFHICALNQTYSFLCPNGTIFSQETLVCVWWNQFDCSLAPSLYSNNLYIYNYEQERLPMNTNYLPEKTQIGIGGSVIPQKQLPARSGTQRTLLDGIYGLENLQPTVMSNFPNVTPIRSTGYSNVPAINAIKSGNFIAPKANPIEKQVFSSIKTPTSYGNIFKNIDNKQVAYNKDENIQDTAFSDTIPATLKLSKN